MASALINASQGSGCRPKPTKRPALRKHTRVGIAICVIVGYSFLLGCEVDTQVAIDGKNPPTFKLSGTGGMEFLRVVELTKDDEDVMEAPVLWEIVPDHDLYETHVSDLPLMTYGRVPTRFAQTRPAAGAPPPALVEGKTYYAWIFTYGANSGGVRFAILEGKSARLKQRARRSVEH